MSESTSANNSREGHPKAKRTLTNILVGPARDVRDPQIFHSLSLVAFRAVIKA